MDALKKLESVRTGGDKLLGKLKQKYTDAELRILAKGGRESSCGKTARIYFSGKSCRFLFFTDSHIGSAYDMPSWILQAFTEGKRAGCEFVVHAGDVTDGMGMGKAGYIYDLRKIGYDEQKKEAVRILREWDRPGYVIAGNHDLWYYKENGANIVEDITDMLNKAGREWTFLGMGSGQLVINGIRVDIFHGEDMGSGYAYSYRVQQITRAMTEQKPHILLTGHDHKMIYCQSRHIHCFGGGALSKRSRFMAQKRAEHHAGFWIIELVVNKRGVATVKQQWFPYYA